MTETPNYTQTPNVFFDDWMKILSPGEFKVLMCINRKTFGWHKTEDSISLSQIVEMSGLSKSGVVRSLSALESRKLIERERKRSKMHGNEATMYKIKVIERKTEKGSEKIPPSALSTQGACPLSTQALVPSGDTQKKDLTKEKKPPTPPLDAEPAEPTKKRLVVVPSFLLDIEGMVPKLAERLAEDFSPDELERAADMLAASGTTIEKPAGWIRSCITDDYKHTPTAPERIADNHTILHQKYMRLDGCMMAGHQVSVGPGYIEFAPLAQGTPTSFTTEQDGMEAMIDKHIEKLKAYG